MKHSRLRELREGRKWSISETADKLHIAKSTYAGYEYGRRDIPNEMLIKIAELYGVTIDYLLGRVDDPSIALVQEEQLLYDAIGELPKDKIKEIFDFRDATEEDVEKILEYIELLKLKRKQETDN